MRENRRAREFRGVRSLGRLRGMRRMAVGCALMAGVFGGCALEGMAKVEHILPTPKKVTETQGTNANNSGGRDAKTSGGQRVMILGGKVVVRDTTENALLKDFLQKHKFSYQLADGELQMPRVNGEAVKSNANNNAKGNAKGNVNNNAKGNAKGNAKSRKKGLTERVKSVTVDIVDSIPGAYDYQLAGYANEAYQLDVTPTSIAIKAVAPIGVTRAVQTLTQMAEGWGKTPSLECVSITDWPAFKLRGYMHDVGRSYIEPKELIQQIADFSRFKVNTFHWHLTENQAWRFESKKYPQLTSSESMTRLPGKYYTQEDMKAVADAARHYGVTIIPEIDMPGHSEAFERAMGFEMQSKQGKEVLKDILEEVAEVFYDAPYIHIGADEKEIKDKKFLPTMVEKVHSLGKKVVVWNPIRGVKISPKAGFDMTQMWGTAGKIVPGIPNIDCRYNYSNHFDNFADIVGIYKSSIYYADKGNPDIAGAISAPWNDRRLATERDIMLQNNTYAATLATAERAWKGGGEEYIEQGGTTLPIDGLVFSEFEDWERRFLFHKENSLKHAAIPYVKQTNVLWEVSDPVKGDDLSEAPTRLARGGGIYLRHTWGDIVPGLYGKGNTPEVGVKAFARTWVYSPKDQTAGALIEFQNYSRSEKDLPPKKGEWDRKGSRVFVNGKEVAAPTWTNTESEVSNETLLGNENLSARKPVSVKLKKGWNEIRLDLPYEKAPGVRLNKWYFAFVLTDASGKNALPGIVYSPLKEDTSIEK